MNSVPMALWQGCMSTEHKNVNLKHPRSAYDRRRNLEVVCAAIKAISNLDVRVNNRDDIVFNADHEDKKVSGTAAKLGRQVRHATDLMFQSY